MKPLNLLISIDRNCIEQLKQQVCSHFLKRREHQDFTLRCWLPTELHEGHFRGGSWLEIYIVHNALVHQLKVDHVILCG